MSGKAQEDQVMSLRIPRSVNDTGELVFGKSEDTMASRETIRLPLTNATGGYLDDSWQVSAEGISLGNDPMHHLNLPLNNTFAFFELVYGIHISRDIVTEIYAVLGAHEDDRIPGAVVDCDTMDTLPDLMFNLAGHKFPITKDEYSGRITTQGGVELCGVKILALDYPREGGREEPHAIALGMLFMEKYEVMFDYGNAELGCGCAHTPLQRTARFDMS